MRSTTLLFVVLALVAAGCTAPAAPTPTLAPTFPPATRMPTRTPRATVTPIPPLPTSTLVPTETTAPTPTADPALAEATLAGMGWIDNYDILLSFDFPGPVDPQDYRVTLEDKPYNCEVIAQYPNRLYCHGQGAKVMAVAVVRVYAAGSPEPGFVKEVWIPFFSNSYNWPND